MPKPILSRFIFSRPPPHADWDTNPLLTQRRAYTIIHTAELESSWLIEDQPFKAEEGDTADVYVLYKFEGPLFDYLSSLRCRIVSPLLIIQTHNYQLLIPVRRVPLWSQSLARQTVGCLGYLQHEQDEISDRVQLLNGVFHNQVQNDTKLVIAKDALSNAARIRELTQHGSTRVLSKSWLDRLYDAASRLEYSYDKFYEEQTLAQYEVLPVTPPLLSQGIMSTASRRPFHPPPAPVFWLESYGNADITQADSGYRPEGYTQYLRAGDEDTEATSDRLNALSVSQPTEQTRQDPSTTIISVSPVEAARNAGVTATATMQMPRTDERTQIVRADKRRSITPLGASTSTGDAAARKRLKSADLQVSTVDPFNETTRHTPRLSTTPTPLSMSIENCLLVFGQMDEQTRVSLTRKVLTMLKTAVEDQFSHRTTHLIIEKIVRSEKLMCSMSRGRWILHADYVRNSLARKHWLDEEEYEFGNPKCHGRLPKSADEKTRRLAAACYRWRVRASDPDFAGAFHNWKVLLYVSHQKHEIFQSFITHGGGQVDFRENCPIPNFFDYTHAIAIDNHKYLRTAEVDNMIKANLKCYKVDYPATYLCAADPSQISAETVLNTFYLERWARQSGTSPI